MEFINFPLVLVCLCVFGSIISLIHFVFFRGSKSSLVENVNSFLPVLWLVLILRSFIVEPFQIPSGSMIPTLKVGDFILVNKFTYGLRLPVWRNKVLDISEPKRGDVMVFFPPHEKRYFIKRVIGIPGDVVKYENKLLTINGEPLQYSDFERGPESMQGYEQIGDARHLIRRDNDANGPISPYEVEIRKGITVKPGHYFMMGDNRDHSSDSRFWGQVPEENIVGKAFYVWMHWQGLEGSPSFSDARTIE